MLVSFFYLKYNFFSICFWKSCDFWNDPLILPALLIFIWLFYLNCMIFKVLFSQVRDLTLTMFLMKWFQVPFLKSLAYTIRANGNSNVLWVILRLTSCHTQEVGNLFKKQKLQCIFCDSTCMFILQPQCILYINWDTFAAACQSHCMIN